MAGPRTAARVLLVATGARQPALEPWLKVEGDIVSYALTRIEPNDLLSHLDDVWDLIVIDGASLPSDDARELLLSAASAGILSPSAVLYLCSAAPSLRERRAALELASDSLERGPWFGPRLRKRVQAIALGPWRRSLALRLRAKGRRHLRLVRRRPRDEEE